MDDVIHAFRVVECLPKDVVFSRDGRWSSPAARRHPLPAVVYYDSAGLHEGGDPRDPLHGDPSDRETSGDAPRDRRVACDTVQHDFLGASPQLLHVAAPLDLLPAVWKRQHDAARLPPDDLLTCVGERDADEDPVWAWGLGDGLESDNAKLTGLRQMG